MLGMDLCGLLSDDYNVIGLDISDKGSSASADFIKCDITDKTGMSDSVKKTDPDLIIHAAAWTNVDGCELDPKLAEKINIAGTENVVVCAGEKTIPVVFLSTDFIFDGQKTDLYDPGDLPDPINTYGWTKLKGEEKVRGLDSYVIIRTSWLYGTNGKNFVDTILEIAKTGKPLKIVSDQMGSPTYTKDLGMAVISLMRFLFSKPDIKNKEICHICNKGVVSWFDYAKRFISFAGLNDVVVNPLSSVELDRPAKRPVFSGLNTAYFEDLTGHCMRSWQDAVKEYIGEKK